MPNQDIILQHLHNFVKICLQYVRSGKKIGTFVEVNEYKGLQASFNLGFDSFMRVYNNWDIYGTRFDLIDEVDIPIIIKFKHGSPNITVEGNNCIISYNTKQELLKLYSIFFDIIPQEVEDEIDIDRQKFLEDGTYDNEPPKYYWCTKTDEIFIWDDTDDTR